MKAVPVVGHCQQHQRNETWERRNTGGFLGENMMGLVNVTHKISVSGKRGPVCIS